MHSGYLRPRAVMLAALLLLAAVLLPATFPPAAATSLAAEPSGWEAVDLPSGLEPACSGLAGIWGNSAADVYAVSSCGSLLHYDGQAWSLRDTGPLASAGLEQDASISAIWGTPDSGLFIAGSERSEEAGPRSVVHYYDPQGHWTTYPLEATDSAAIDGLWGASASDLYAVGGDDVMGSIFHWEGTVWTTPPMEDGKALVDFQLQGIWGSSASDVFAVGGGRLSEEMGVVFHYDGSAWLLMDTDPTAANLRAVWGSSASDVFAVGLGGTILHYDGSDWTLSEGSTLADLHAVWGSSASDVFAAGYDPAAEAAVILHFDGSSWSSAMAGVTAPEVLRGLWGSSASDVWAVGDAGTVLHYAIPQHAEPGPPDPAAPTDPSPTPPGDSTVPLPLIAGLHRDAGRPGEALTVSITGSNLGGATAADFGAGITVAELAVVSDNELSARIAIDGDAAIGQRMVSVTTSQGIATMPDGFAVQQSPSGTPRWVWVAAAVAGAAAAAILAFLASRRLSRRPR